MQYRKPTSSVFNAFPSRVLVKDLLVSVVLRMHVHFRFQELLLVWQFFQCEHVYQVVRVVVVEDKGGSNGGEVSGCV